MSLIGLVLTLVVVGGLRWVLNNYVPSDGTTSSWSSFGRFRRSRFSDHGRTSASGDTHRAWARRER